MNWAIRVDLPGRVRSWLSFSVERSLFSKMPYLKEVSSLSWLTLSISFNGAISSSLQ